MFDNTSTHRAELAGADRRRERGQGLQGRARWRGLDAVGRDDEDQRRGAADPRGRRAQDPPADLPRGQLLRRPQARHAGAPTSSTRATRSRSTQTARRCSSTRSSARCRATRARTSRSCCRATATAIGGEPTPGEDDDQDPDTQGETAGKSLNDSLEDAPEALRGTAIVNQALARHASRATCPSWSTGTSKVSAALGQPRDPAQGPDLQLQHHHGRAGRRAGQPARDDPRCCPQVLEAANPAFDELNASFPPHARVRARDHPGRARDAGHDRGVAARGSRRRARSSRTAELQRPGATTSARPSATSPVHRRAARVPARRPTCVNRCLAEQPAAHRRRRDPGRRRSPPASRTTRSSSRRWSDSSGESQNFDGNGTYTRFQTGGGDQTVSDRPASAPAARCSPTPLRPPLGHPPGAPGAQAAATTRDQRLLHSRRART